MSAPATDPTIFAYERGTQTFLITGATGTVAQVGTAKPVASNAIGIVPEVSRAQLPFNLTVQIDVGGTGSWTAYTVNILGSLDGVKFYVVGSVNGTGGQLATVSLFPLRYISASITTATISSGAPTLSVSVAL